MKSNLPFGSYRDTVNLGLMNTIVKLASKGSQNLFRDQSGLLCDRPDDLCKSFRPSTSTDHGIRVGFSHERDEATIENVQATMALQV